MPLAVQARRGKFVSAGDREPLFWLKHDPVRLLDADVSLKAARVPAEARVELAVAFTSIDLLPDSTANRVPDPNKGTPLQPPGAFTARFLLLTCSPCMGAVCPHMPRHCTTCDQQSNQVCMLRLSYSIHEGGF